MVRLLTGFVGGVFLLCAIAEATKIGIDLTGHGSVDSRAVAAGTLINTLLFFVFLVFAIALFISTFRRPRIVTPPVAVPPIIETPSVPPGV